MVFERYKKMVEKYFLYDCRETNFQNRVLIPFLEEVIPVNLDVVNVSNLYKNWNGYKDDKGNGVCRDTFAGKYTPDIILSDKWELFSKEKEKSKLIIEVKRLTAKDRKHAENEVTEYKKFCDNVIITDCMTWEFYSKNQEVFTCFLDENKKKVCKQINNESRKIKWINEKEENNNWNKLNSKLNGIFADKQEKGGNSI